MKVNSPLAHLIAKDVVSNLKLRAKIHHIVMENPEYAEVFREACAKDPIFFCNLFCWTYDPRKEPFAKIPFILYDFQEEALLEILRAINDYDLLIEKSRTMGVSWLNLVAFVWILCFTKNRNGLLGSRTEELVEKSGDAKALMWRVDYLVDNLPQWLRLGYDKGRHRLKKHIELPESGCSIDAESTTDNFGTGDRRFYIFLDEFSKVPNGDSMLASTQPVTNSRIINGTPFGIKNAFYDLTHHTRIKKLRLHWTLHPVYAEGLYHKEAGEYVIDDEAYWARIDNPQEKMEEYDAIILERGVPLPESKKRSPWYAKECARAKSATHVAQELDINYLGSGGQYFDPEKVQATIQKYARSPELVGDLEYDHQTGDPIRFRENSKGCLKLWITLNKDSKPSLNYLSALGTDISAGTGASNSAASGWDSKTGKKLCEYANPRIRPEEFAKQIKALATWLGGSQVIWEARGPGLEFGAKLMELNYANVYLRRNDASIKGKISDTPGWAPGKDSKSVLLGNYRDVIETSECCNYSEEALSETLEYVYGQDGSPVHARSINKDDPSGAKANHGDRVIADALAWKLMTYTRGNPEENKINHKPEIAGLRSDFKMLKAGTDHVKHSFF